MTDSNDMDIGPRNADSDLSVSAVSIVIYLHDDSHILGKVGMEFLTASIISQQAAIFTCSSLP